MAQANAFSSITPVLVSPILAQQRVTFNLLPLKAGAVLLNENYV